MIRRSGSLRTKSAAAVLLGCALLAAALSEDLLLAF